MVMFMSNAEPCNKEISYSHAGAAITLHYTKEDTDPNYPVVRIMVGERAKFVPSEDKEFDEGVH